MFFRTSKIESLLVWLLEHKDTFKLSDVKMLTEHFTINSEYNKLQSIIFIPFKQEDIFPCYETMKEWNREKAYSCIPVVINFLKKARISEARQYETENGIYLKLYWSDKKEGGKSKWLFNCHFIKYLVERNGQNETISLDYLMQILPYEDYKNYITQIRIENQQNVFLSSSEDELYARDIIMNSGDKKCENTKLAEIKLLDSLSYKTIPIHTLNSDNHISYEGMPKEDIFASGHPSDFFK
jgi:hypothetical protein